MNNDISPTNAGATDVFLKVLKALGTDFLFTNPGPEFSSLAAHFQRGPVENLPKPMVVPHEALAVSMAHGYYLATGRPQTVMANFNVGLANALVHLIAASNMNIPLLFINGRPPAAECDGPGARSRPAHWVHEAFDQTNMAREYMKWDYEVRQPGQLREVLVRAWEVMNSSPKGPVSISLSREILLAGGGVGDIPEPQPLHPPGLGATDIEKIRAALTESSRPLLITSRSGLNPQMVALVEEFAERYQVGVICPLAQAVNIRTTHSCFLGFTDERVLKEADFILVLDTDVPWIPSQARPSTNARVIHVGPDPLFGKIPLRSFRSDLNVQAGIEQALQALLAVAPPAGEKAVSAWVRSNREALQTAILQAPMAKFNPSAVAEILSLALDDETVLINESSLPAESLKLEHPGTYLRTGSVLGWSMGCALGFKLGRPGSIPIAVVGDGAYYLSQPMAAQWVSQNRNLPFLTVVLNDGGQSAGNTVKQFSSISPGLPFAEMAQAGGAFGATARTRPELKAAVDEGLAAVKSGRMALIDARF